MLEQVENKILELKKRQTEEYYKKKDADLQAWGLTYKTEGNKVTPIIVTDEEYEALIKASSGVDRVGRNAYAKLLNALTYVAIGVGCLSGAVLAALSDELRFIYFTVCAIIGLVFAVIFKSISEVIRLLQQIIDSKPLEKPEGVAPSEQPAHPKTEKPQTQAPTYQQVPVQPVYSPVYPHQVPVQGGPTVFSQQPPVYIYQQPAQPQPQQPAQPQQTKPQ